MATLSLNPHKELTLKDHVKARAATMTALVDQEKTEWHEIALYSGYPITDGLAVKENGRRRPRSRPLYDGHSIRVFRYVESGLYSGNSSPNRPWFNFALKRDRGGKSTATQATKIWFGQCVSVLSMIFAGSNFYRVVRSNYGQLGRFGNAAAIMDDDDEFGINCIGLKIGEFACDVNRKGKVDTLLRWVQMTTRQLVDGYVRRFDGSMDWSAVDPSVQTAWNASNYTATFLVYHLIEPNSEYRERGWGAAGMKWRSVKWMAADSHPTRILENRGYIDQPFWVARWAVDGTDVWATGPGRDALPDMRELQAQSKRKGEVTDMVVKPPTQGPRDFKMRPGQHTALASVDAGEVKVVYQAPYQAIEKVSADVQECRRAISEATYADLFMAITERDGVQPLNDLETQLRNDEKMTQLGPVIESINVDMLKVAVERAFGIALRGGLFPLPPEELEDEEIDIEFISVLAQAQKMMGAGQTERSLAFVGAVAQFQPDAIDLVDGDALVRDHWERSAAPAVGMRDPSQVEQIRSNRQQLQQQERMAAMAQPAKAGVEAAALLNEIGQQ